MTDATRHPTTRMNRPSSSLSAFVLVSAMLTAAIANVVSAAPVEDTAEVVPPPPVIDHSTSTPWVSPERPPICNGAQIELGDVRACVVKDVIEPDASDWPTPPAPGSGDPTGWIWNGYDYRGSPELEEWESTMITDSTVAFGEVDAGAFESNARASQLFEGFLQEIDSLGYEIRTAFGYGYRCTAGSGGWSCPSGNIAGLSLHSWGLALDMNADANPITTYRHPNGGNACSVPMETDIPMWVVQVAEKWGLYWGGYGWGDGCATSATSVYRDPPHFEFRGSPELADRIISFNLRTDPNLGCYDVVDTHGDERLICNRDFTVEAGWRVKVNPSAPDGATAALVNLTATRAEDKGFLTLESCGSRAPGMPETSNLNFEAAVGVANLALIELDDDGEFCVYHDAVAHAIVDVIAFLVPSAESSPARRLLLDAPRRVVDSRSQPLCLQSGECDTSPAGHQSTTRITNAPTQPYLANLTVTQSERSGYLSAGGCSAMPTGEASPSWSNLNFERDVDRANLSILLPDESGETCVYSWGSTDIIVDVLGTFTDGQDGFGWQPVAARRMLDTRKCRADICNIPVASRSVVHIPVDTDAPAVVVNVTATAAPTWGYVTVDACSTLESLSGAPSTSTVNVNARRTSANLTIAPVEEGEICAWSFGEVHLIVDVQAELSEDAVFGLLVDEPVRVYDGRRGNYGSIPR